MEFTKKTADRLTQKNWSVEIDDNTESIGKKVRQAQLEQFNYILVIGDKEIESESFNIRTRENKQISNISLQCFYSKTKRRRKNPQPCFSVLIGFVLSCFFFLYLC